MRLSCFRCGGKRRGMLVAMYVLLISTCPSSSSSEDEESSRSLSLRIVHDVYEEEGVTIRHLGALTNIAAMRKEEMIRAHQTAPGSLVDFQAMRIGAHWEESAAYTVAVRGAVVGYEGLVFDPERLFNLEGSFSHVFSRPEVITFERSADKPRLNPLNETQALVQWGRSWPEGGGWGGWKRGAKDFGDGWEFSGRVMNLCQRSSHAYYHFLAETLPLIQLMWTDLATYADAVVLVDTSFGNAWTPALLSLAGLHPSRIRQRDPTRVFLADTVHIPRPTPLHRPFPLLLRRLRNTLLAASFSPSSPPAAAGQERACFWEGGEEEGRRERERETIVVVMRTSKNNQHSSQHQACKAAGGCRVREITNGQELLLALATAFPNYAVEGFDSSQRTLPEQVRVFASARAVIGAHGAGLSNAIFAPAGTVVLELLPPIVLHASVATIFWHLCSSLNITHRAYLIPPALMLPDDPASLHNFRLDPHEIVRILKGLLS